MKPLTALATPSRVPAERWHGVDEIFIFAVNDGTVDGLPSVYSRMFAPELGIPEGPATGAATGPLAAYILRHELLDANDTRRFVSEQGVKMGRRSVLHVRVSSTDGHLTIEVGGAAVEIASGTMTV